MTTPTNPTARSLAERATNLRKGWMAGMLSLPDSLGRTWRCHEKGFTQVDGRRLRCKLDVWEIVYDLDDPATLGCLLALLREAYGCEVVALPAGRAWWWAVVADGRRRTLEGGVTKKEALVAALEAAP